MKPLTREWVKKAEGDFVIASRELRARKAPNYDAVCFHAQQCAEKYLKACLQEAGIHFAKTHDLLLLIDLLPQEMKPRFELLRPYMSLLSAYAVDFRYPGDSADKEQAKEAVGFCREVRQVSREFLGLKP